MRIVILIFLVHLFVNHDIQCQKLNIYYGVEINQTRFRQYAPLINVPFKNPHMAGFGLSTYLSIVFNFNNAISLQFAPKLGLYNTKSDITQDYQLNVYGFRFAPYFKCKKIIISGGFEFNRLIKIFGTTTKGTKSDWTWFAHRRNLIGPTVSVGFNVFNHFNLNLVTTYFLKDFYSSGALDHDGNIVGPVEVTPLVFSFGVEYKIDFSKLKSRKK